MSKFVSLTAGNSLSIDLGTWSTVATVKVLHANNASVATHDVEIFVHDDSSSFLDASKGKRCTFEKMCTNGATEGSSGCLEFECVGTTVQAFHGNRIAVHSVSGEARILRVEVMGNPTRCKYGDVTDEDGEYGFDLVDDASNRSEKSEVHIGAYKEEVENQTLKTVDCFAEGDDPQALFVTLRDGSTRNASTLPVTDRNDFLNFTVSELNATHDAKRKDGQDAETLWTKDEFEKMMERILPLSMSAVFVVPEELWRKRDNDADALLTREQVMGILEDLSNEVLLWDLAVAYPPCDVKDLRNFRLIENDWRNYSDAFPGVRVLMSDQNQISSLKQAQRVFYDGISDLMETSLDGNLTVAATLNSKQFTVPLLAWRGLDITQMVLRSEAFLTSTRVHIEAIHQYADVVHVFDEPPVKGAAAKKELAELQHVFSGSARTKPHTLKVRHKRIEEKDFTDDTTVVARGAVLFPKNRTAQSDKCGLSAATIDVHDEDGVQSSHTTNEFGWFEIALTRGKRYTLEAKYKNHHICYAGDSAENAVESDCGDHEFVASAEDGSKQFVSHGKSIELFTIKDQTVFFVDVTPAEIDLGLYMGECDARIVSSDVRFAITPSNGCHATVEVNARELGVGDWVADAVDDSGYVRRWPYAAMDYSISIVNAPDVAKDLGTMDFSAFDFDANDCTAPDDVSDVLTYLKDKDEHSKFVGFKDGYDGVADAKFKYHGHLCVRVMDVTQIEDKAGKSKQTCYDRDERNDGELKSHHFLGESKYEKFNEPIDVKLKKITVRAFELYAYKTSGNFTFNTCSVFPSPAVGSGSTTVKYRQSVTNEEDNECHPNRGDSPLCDFQADVSSVGAVLFPTAEGSPTPFAEVTAGVPNLAFPYRRSFEITINRDDQRSVVSKTVKRELISLGSKIRGGESRGDDTFWATVPIDGLVYTVVHDPPGGDSYAELTQGTTLGLHFARTDARAMSSATEVYSDVGAYVPPVKVDSGIATGYIAEIGLGGEWNMFDAKIQGKYTLESPALEISNTNRDGWGIEILTNQVIRSSQDVALPGRAGDTILGGGIELVYKISDELDVDEITNCLASKSNIVWLPRKPTTYVFNVATVETRVLPNLRNLLSKVRRGAVKEDGSNMAYPCEGTSAENDSQALCTDEEMLGAWTHKLDGWINTWKGTLLWASPPIYWKRNGESRERDETNVEGIMSPMLEGANAIGRRFRSISNTFTNLLVETPAMTYAKQVRDAWDATTWLAPYNGLGPLPMFKSPDETIGDLFSQEDTWMIDEYFWEDTETDGTEALAKMEGESLDTLEKYATTKQKWGEKKVLMKGSATAFSAAGEVVANYASDHMIEPLLEVERLQEELEDAMDSELQLRNSSPIKRLRLTGQVDDATRKVDEKIDELAKNKKKVSRMAIEFKDAEKKYKAMELRKAASDSKKSFKNWLQKNYPSTKTKNAKIVGGVLAAGAATGIGYWMWEQRQRGLKSTYPYILYPRNAYKSSLPSTADGQFAFSDLHMAASGVGDALSENALAKYPFKGHYTFGVPEETLDDYAQTNLTSYFCESIACEKGELEKKRPLRDHPFDKFDLGENQGIKGGSNGLSGDRALASFTGGLANAGMKERGKQPSEKTMLLTFSGGGQSVDYLFESDEELLDKEFALNIETHGKGINEHEYEFGGILGTVAQLALLMSGIEEKEKRTFTKSIGTDRTFAWNKHGVMSTLYTLGDPHIGDKFVVQVGSDTRFGTPVFITKGGRSLCPAEEFTVWREDGFTLHMDEDFAYPNDALDPDQRAVFRFTIMNESPYREAAPLGIRIVDALALSVHETVAAAYEAADRIDATAEDVLAATERAVGQSKASGADILERMSKAAKIKASESDVTSFGVADAVFEVSKTAPPTGFELHSLEFLAMYEWIPALGDVVPLKFPQGDSLRAQDAEVRKTTFTMSVGRYEEPANEVKYAALQLVSLCEFDISEGRNFNREPLGHTLRLGTMAWHSACPEISFDGATLDAYAYALVSRAGLSSLSIQVIGDLEADNLKFSRLQYRRASSGGEWVSARANDGAVIDLAARDVEFPLEWDLDADHLLNGLKDGEYEVRVKNFCRASLPSNAASSSVFQYASDATLTLNVDSFAPTQQGKYEDKSSRTIWVKYLEEIDCSEMNVRLTENPRREVRRRATWNRVADGAESTIGKSCACTRQIKASGSWSTRPRRRDYSSSKFQISKTPPVTSRKTSRGSSQQVTGLLTAPSLFAVQTNACPTARACRARRVTRDWRAIISALGETRSATRAPRITSASPDLASRAIPEQ